MSRSIGIYVSSDRHLDQLIALCKAAHKKGVKTMIFFTHHGTRLCTHPRLKELEKFVQIAICKVGFEANKLEKSDALADDKAYSTQAWHAELIYECDRYLTF